MTVGGVVFSATTTVPPQEDRRQGPMRSATDWFRHRLPDHRLKTSRDLWRMRDQLLGAYGAFPYAPQDRRPRLRSMVDHNSEPIAGWPAPRPRTPPSGGACARTGDHRCFLRARPTFSLAARHNQCRTEIRRAERISAGGSRWDRRGGHGGPIFLAFARARSLFGTAGAARTGARPTEPPASRRVYERFTEADESSLRRPGTLRSLGRSSRVRLAPAQGGPRAEPSRDAVCWGGPFLGGGVASFKPRAPGRRSRRNRQDAAW